MTKILILHASLGAGHVSAARSLAAALTELGVDDVRVEDGLDYADALVRTVITKGFLKLTESAPELWRSLYEGSDEDDFEETLKSNLLMGEIQRPFYGKLERLIREMNPDAIISVQQFPLLIVQALKSQGRISQPNYVVITDFMAHSSWIHQGVERYFVAADFTKDVLARWGVDPTRLAATGIPVRLELAEPKSQAAMRRAHDLPVEGHIVTLFAGGIEPTRVRRMVDLTLDAGERLTLVTVAGRNAKLAAALADVQGNPAVQLRKLGFIDYVDDLVAASDLVLTKSGGLIVSEVLARGTPMIIVDPIPGQEEWNADFAVSCGAAVQVRLPEMAPAAMLGLLSKPKQLAQMRTAALAHGKPRAANDIAKSIMNDLAR